MKEEDVRMIGLEEVMKANEREIRRLTDLRSKTKTKGRTAGLKGELQRLPCSPPLTHWLMRSATPTFKPSASCFFFFKQQN